MNPTPDDTSPLTPAQLEDLRVAVILSGGARTVAQRMGYKTGESVRRFYAGEKAIPSEKCRALRKALGQRLTLTQLRPDVYGGLTQEQLGDAPRKAAARA